MDLVALLAVATPAPEPTGSGDGLNVAAFVISCCAFGMSGAAVGWQVCAFLLSGGRAKATLMFGVVQGSGDTVVGPVTAAGEPPMRAEQLIRQGITGQPVVGIPVTNHGRAPLTVEKVDMRARGGPLQYVPIGHRLGPDLPYRLEPGSNATWYLPAAHVDSLVGSTREVLSQSTRGVYMTAQLGTGKTVETPQTLRA